MQGCPITIPILPRGEVGACIVGRGRNALSCRSHLILSILLDEEGQVPGRRQQHVGRLLRGQEGEDAGHQALSFPDAHDLHEVVIAQPVKEMTQPAQR